MVVSTSPDTFAVVEPFDDPVVIRFSERISERPTGGGTLADAVVVSPATSEVEVDHGRSSLEISLADGYRPGQVYRVRVLPVIQDLFDNPMVSPFELVFSTGPDFHPGVVAGVVRDRITGNPVGGARVHARAEQDGDTMVYGARTDDDGIYTVRYLSPGSYRLIAFEDRNRSGGPDGDEPRGEDQVMLDGPADTLVVPVELLAPDTTAARIVGAEAVDSASLRVETDDFLNPAEPLTGVRVSLSRADDGGAPAVDSVLHEYEWQARTGGRTGETDDAGPPDTLPEPDADAPQDRPQPPEPGDAGADTVPEDAPAGPYGAGEPPRAEQAVYVLLEGPLAPDVEYRVTVSGIRNIAGVEEGGGEATVTWTRPPPEEDAAVPDTIPGLPESLDGASDTLDALPDTPDAGPDTLDAEPDTVGVQPDGARRGPGSGGGRSRHGR